MLYEFQQSYDVTEEIFKNIGCVKGEFKDDHGTETRWFRKFHSTYKKRDDQALRGFRGRVPSNRGKFSEQNTKRIMRAGYLTIKSGSSFLRQRQIQ